MGGKKKKGFRGRTSEAPEGIVHKADPLYDLREDMDDVLDLTDRPQVKPGSDSDREEEIMLPQEDDEDYEDYEEDDGGFKQALQEEKKKQGKKQGNKRGPEEDDLTAVQEVVRHGTSGWRKDEYHGGEDDASDAGSDEELNFEEAKRMEEVRARRLGMASADAWSVLLGGADPEEMKESEAATKAAEEKAGAAAKFESVFAEGAEHDSVPREISQLSESRRKKLVKSEAPELAPLLEDFKENLGSLKQLLPLLAPDALSQLPASGAAYLDAKLNLLLSTLANLSYYTLLRAEGAQVRTHPVVTQLVWLKELQEKLQPLDLKLRSASRRAARLAKRIAAGELTPTAGLIESEERKQDAVSAPVADAPRRPGIRERLQKLRLQQATAAAAAAAPTVEAKRAAQPKTADLLRLPGQKKRDSGDGAPADLHEVDPTLGAWVPKSTLGAEVMMAQQYVRDWQTRKQQKSADLDVDPKGRPTRDRRQSVEELQQRADESTSLLARNAKASEAPVGALDEDEDDPLVREARSKSKVKKEQRSERERQRAEAAQLRQWRPEEEMEGRRKTSQKILKNRGLVRPRKKDASNARVVNKKKYQKKVMKHASVVTPMREGPQDGVTYGGEETGIRTSLKKSQKLN